MNEHDSILINELIHKSLEGEISAQESKLLNTFVSDPENAAYYVKCLRLHSRLKRGAECLRLPVQTDSSDSLSLALKELAGYEKTAPAIEVEKPIPEKVPVEMLKIEKSPWTVNKSSLYSAIVSVAAMILLLILVQVAPKRAASVAKITDSINAQWAQSKYPTDIGSVLWNNEGLRRLQKGTVKIEFHYGAEVIIEGPAEFELENADKMILHSGRLYAAVPGRATGFTVQTPYSTVIDLGTEFGVEVGFDGSTDVHMFKGKASLVPGANGEKKKSLGLVAGQAKSVNTNAQVREIEFKKQAFVRKFDSETGFLWRGKNLDLADIVGGGSGFGKSTRGYCINSKTGQISKRAAFAYDPIAQNAEGSYISVTGSPFIDGVFVPDGDKEVIVSSQNDVFAECPDTNRQIFSPIVNVPEGWGNNIATVKLSFGSEVYGGDVKPAICMETNQGITFDLEAIRKAMYGEVTIEEFQAVCGISSEVLKRWNMNVKASIWVLVDGEVRFKAVGIDVVSGKHNVNVKLHETDRFLTLVTTDGGDGTADSKAHNHDACFFGEPVLVLE